MDNIFVERLWRSLKYEEVYLHAYANVAEAKTGIGAGCASTTRSASTRATASGRRGRCTKRKAGGYVDDRLRRPAPLPPLPEQARKAGKCSPSPTYPPAQHSPIELILMI